MKTKKIYLTLALVAAFSFITIAAFSHGYDSRYGYGHMMGPGYGYGHMGYGYGNGYMGRGYMHDGTYNNIDDLQAWLNLSDEQVKQIIKLDSEYNEKIYESRGNRIKIYELREQYNKDFEKLLTSVQKNKFNEGRNYRGSFFCRW